MQDDQSIETSSEESRINYDFTNDPPISFKELLENEVSIKMTNISKITKKKKSESKIYSFLIRK